MSETSQRVLDLFCQAMAQMSETEQEMLLWFSEGLAAAARAQRAAQDSA